MAHCQSWMMCGLGTAGRARLRLAYPRCCARGDLWRELRALVSKGSGMTGRCAPVTQTHTHTRTTHFSVRHLGPHLGIIYTTYGGRYGTPEPPIHRCAGTAPRGTCRTVPGKPSPPPPAAAASSFARFARALRCFCRARRPRRRRPPYHTHVRLAPLRAASTNGGRDGSDAPPPRSRRRRPRAAPSPAVHYIVAASDALRFRVCSLRHHGDVHEPGHSRW